MTNAVGARRVAVVQSNYVPWKGYFDLIGLADHFVLYDDVQYTKNDWRNRNRIKTAQGVRWLTIPVEHAGRFGQRIDEARIAGHGWRAKHWQTIVQSYAKAPFFSQYASALEEIYRDEDLSLSRTNEQFTRRLCECLGITTPITRSTDYELGTDRVERLVELCVLLDADAYLSGPSARGYLDESAFTARGVWVEYMDYGAYPEYTQLHPPFEHHVSVIDLLLNLGDRAANYMKFSNSARGVSVG